MKALDRKLLRDLWTVKAQAISIALVIACGVAAFIGSLSTHASLLWSRDHYYDSARFAHVFATAKRAPASLGERLRLIPGVVEVETRIVRDAQLSLERAAAPMIGRMVGVDFEHPTGMNRLKLTAGRWPSPRARDEAVVNQRFFEARGLVLGEIATVLLNGRLERMAIVGTALSPEYIYATRGGGMPDDEWFAVLWVDAGVLAAASGMEGAFNSVLLRLERGASTPGAIAALDRILEPYGGLGAVGREDQPSDKILSQEIDQQRVFGIVLPAIFLAVAAFIVNVVMHRQVTAQRSEVATLKALGYADRRIAGHYLGFAAVIVLAGLALGVALGAWLGQMLTALYTGFFHFPRFHYALPAWLLAGAAAAAFAAAFGGALAAIRGILRLRAAEALRPPAPAQFRPLLLERLGYARLLTPAQRMIMRTLERRPLRAVVTVLGICGSAAILIAGTFWGDALEWFMDAQFNQVNRASVQVAFAEPVDANVRFELARLPGVRQVEVTRSIPVRLRSGHRSYRTALTGIADDASLLRVLDAQLRPVAATPDAVVLTKRLAERLGLRTGEIVQVEMQEGRRVRADLRVAAIVDEMAGMNAWMRLPDLNRLAREGRMVSSAQLLVERIDEPLLLEKLKAIPAAAVVIVNRTLLETFRETSARNVLIFTTVLTVFAAVIATGVVYNNARIQLAERSWELASLRVLGFTRREVSVMLLGELALEIAIAIPLGLLAGYGLAALLLVLMPHEVLAIPLVVFPKTYLYAAAIVAAAGVVSAMAVRDRIDRLDLVAVLKTRE